MSVDEDTELQDLLVQTLEANGCFAKIRAQLRASIYLALDENETLQKREPTSNTKLKASLGTDEGRLMFCIVREFLEYFDLDFTLAVYESESYLGSHCQYKDREQIVNGLNLPDVLSDLNAPVLLQIIRLYRSSESKRKDSDGNRSGKPVETTIDDKGEGGNHSIPDSSNGNELNGDKTFDVNSPMFQKEKDEASENAETLDKNKKMEPFNVTADADQSATSELEVSPPIVKDGKYSKEKSKLSTQKIEKVKVRNNLSSLSDMPPIPVNKPRSNEMLLPPLYTKEFKEMNSQKELEKMFDLDALDNYEEDFMSESEIDLVLSKGDAQDGSKVKLIDERTKRSVNAERGTDLDFGNVSNDRHSPVSSVASNEFSSNLDDILTSC